MWTIAKVKNGFADLPNERFHTFAIKRNGEVIGHLKYDHSRWKSAGGPAWKAEIYDTRKHPGADCVSFHSKDKNKVLEWVKQSFSA